MYNRLSLWKMINTCGCVDFPRLLNFMVISLTVTFHLNIYLIGRVHCSGEANPTILSDCVNMNRYHCSFLLKSIPRMGYKHNLNSNRPNFLTQALPLVHWHLLSPPPQDGTPETVQSLDHKMYRFPGVQ